MLEGLVFHEKKGIAIQFDPNVLINAETQQTVSLRRYAWSSGSWNPNFFFKNAGKSTGIHIQEGTCSKDENRACRKMKQKEAKETSFEACKE